MALKEWAVAVNVMARGRQIVTVRKGGIHRDDREFRIVHPEFLLYPTYEHQRQELLKEEFHSDQERTLEEDDIPGLVTLGYWCQVTDKFEVGDAEVLAGISAPSHLDGRLRREAASLEAQAATHSRAAARVRAPAAPSATGAGGVRRVHVVGGPEAGPAAGLHDAGALGRGLRGESRRRQAGAERGAVHSLIRCPAEQRRGTFEVQDHRNHRDGGL